MELPTPRLERTISHGVCAWTDARLARETGAVIAFSERGGGVSSPPYSGLNVAAHVGDDPSAVEENRRRLLELLELAPFTGGLTIPEQTHGSRIVVVDDSNRGSGALAGRGIPPLAATDALVTVQEATPLLLCFADCVPVILVAPGPGIAVAHAGWRGALASIPGNTARALAAACGCETSEVTAYIGPHIRACHYEVDETLLSQFVNTFGTLARVESRGLDLEFAVTASLIDAGVARCSIASLGTCTAEVTDRFFSYRAEQGLTGRHAALACILPRA